MSFSEHVKQLQRELYSAGYAPIRDPVDISEIAKGDRIIECEIVGRKDFFNVLYMEAESNWKGIASAVVKKSKYPCLAITRYGNTHHVFTAVRDHGTRNARPRHVVLETGSNTALMSKFICAIKVDPADDHLAVDGRTQKAFDKFSEYKQALDEFAENLDTIIKKTRAMIDGAISGNEKYETQAKKMLRMCREIISDRMDMDDIKSMLIQHILTYRIFALVYSDFRATNVVARSLEDIISILDLPCTKVSYKTMELVAESLTETSQKQDFLKKVYETFYKKYDPAKAKKHGIVYTPSEVVQFMVRSTDELLQKHFGRCISDNDVVVLDPATGTGTFMVHVMRQIGRYKLERKYVDLHANEISLLAYYIAALNIELTYQEITGKHREFENICLMDTLATGTKDLGKVSAYFKSQDNVKRILKQQNKDICVVLGNPPYNAVQVSFNESNPSDKYGDIDAKIADTYVKNSTVRNIASKYDMYLRFMKWASERIKNNGMVVFVSNNSFLDAKSNDGFRRSVFEEFDYIYVVNLKGNARLAGDAWKQEGGKIFGHGARVGVAISFFIKTGEKESKIQYAEVDDCVNRVDKLKWIADNSISTLKLQSITPNADAIWLNQTDNDFDALVPVVHNENAIFSMFSYGSKSNRDDWVYSFDHTQLENKMKYFISFYNDALIKYHEEKPTLDLKDWTDKKIKWTHGATQHLLRKNQLKYSQSNIVHTLYRPFVSKNQYFDKIVTERTRKFPMILSNSKPNKLIGFTNPSTNVVFQAIAADKIVDGGCILDTQCIPLYTYDDKNERRSNITEFGLKLFQTHYKSNRISDKDVFYYTYAIFNDPKYSKEYAFNLQRQFPRIPLAPNFKDWVSIGKMLYNLHAGFKDVEPYPLERVDKKVSKNRTILRLKKLMTTCPGTPKPSTSENRTMPKLKIAIDDQTTLENIPNEVLDYKFSSKCALEWILEFYKESKNVISEKSCDDPRIRSRFNTYRFADHKEHVIDLLQRVTTVSVETIKMRSKLKKMSWGEQPEWRLLYVKRNVDGTSPQKNVNRAKPKKSRKLNNAVGLQDTLVATKQKRLI